MSHRIRNHLLMGISVICGLASLFVGTICLYHKEYIIGGALLFNIFICYTSFQGWRKAN